MIDNNLSLKDFLEDVLPAKVFIFIMTLLITLSGIFYSLTLHDLYKSTAIIKPVDEKSSPEISSNFSQLASFTGIDLIQGNQSIEPIIATLQSRSFLNNFTKERSLKSDIFALVYWDGEKKIFDKSIYDVQKNTWVGLDNIKLEPSEEDVHEHYLDNLSVIKLENGLIEISYISRSPLFSKKVIEWLIQDINNFKKNKDVRKYEDSITFLKNQLSLSSASETRLTISALISNNLKDLALANISDDYIFEYIDEPFIPEKKTYPRRSLIAILSMFGGILTSIVTVIFLSILNLRFKKNSIYKINKRRNV